MEENQIKPTIDILDLTGIRLRIWGLLKVYPELSFTELAKKLGKSKSTIHPHLQKLIELGIVEISKKEHIRANIEAHYYSLTTDADEKTLIWGYDLSDGLDKELVQKIAKSRKSFAIYNRKMIDRYIKFCEYIEETDSDDIVEFFKQIYTTTNYTKQDISLLYMGGFFLTENQWKRWQKLFYKLGMEFEEQCAKEQKENPNQEKYIYFYNIGIPVKILFEEMELKRFTNKK
ncbi:MAG: winged helix-turn-helix domain-containing protein [Promethearchaeota archaeon]